jgi:hypothetical protein
MSSRVCLDANLAWDLMTVRVQFCVYAEDGMTA